MEQKVERTNQEISDQLKHHASRLEEHYDLDDQFQARLMLSAATLMTTAAERLSEVAARQEKARMMVEYDSRAQKLILLYRNIGIGRDLETRPINVVLEYESYSRREVMALVRLVAAGYIVPTENEVLQTTKDLHQHL